jgi:hypothetical protein
MKRTHKIRRTIVAVIVLIIAVVTIAYHPNLQQPAISPPETPKHDPSISATGDAAAALESIPVKGRAAKTGYTRTQFGDGWATKDGCDTRNIILHRDLTDTTVDESCRILTGILNDPYTGKVITFSRGEASSQAVQIDHVVALSNAWQTGAQGLTAEQRIALANDPLELLAVDGPANQQKSDGDAATWLPANKAFRCQYVARQISVKAKYQLWVTSAEKDAMIRILQDCPGQTLPQR